MAVFARYIPAGPQADDTPLFLIEREIITDGVSREVLTHQPLTEQAGYEDVIDMITARGWKIVAWHEGPGDGMTFELQEGQ